MNGKKLCTGDMLLLQAEASGVSQYKAYVLNDKNTTIIYQDAI